jgi:hypothetical protein
MLVNLTPHPITFEGGRTLPKCDQPPRLREEAVFIGMHEGVAIMQKLIDRVGCELPPPAGGTLYIVPLAIAMAFPGRDDLVVPHELVRDAHGRVTACRSLAQIVP